MGSRDFVNMVKTSRGFVRAEDVIGVRNPVYNEDNISHETLAHYGLTPQFHLTTPVNSVSTYERSSRRLIQQGLASIR